MILKLFYYAISILSHRTRTQNQIHSHSYTRRLNAARNVIQIFGESKGPLPPTPILPYALSLALTTFYAQVREGHGKCISEYTYCIEKLTYYGEWWWVAGAMAKLGIRAINGSGQRRAVEEKECAAVLSSLKSTGDDPKNAYSGAPRERIAVHKAIASGMLTRYCNFRIHTLTHITKGPQNHRRLRHRRYRHRQHQLHLDRSVESYILKRHRCYQCPRLSRTCRLRRIQQHMTRACPWGRQ